MYGSILTTATLNASLISETSQKFNRLFETSSCLIATASKQTIQNVVIATHQDSITFHYSPLTTPNKKFADLSGNNPPINFRRLIGLKITSVRFICSGTRLIRTPRGHAIVSVLCGCQITPSLTN